MQARETDYVAAFHARAAFATQSAYRRRIRISSMDKLIGAGCTHGDHDNSKDASQCRHCPEASVNKHLPFPPTWLSYGKMSTKGIRFIADRWRPVSMFGTVGPQAYKAIAFSSGRRWNMVNLLVGPSRVRCQGAHARADGVGIGEAIDPRCDIGRVRFGVPIIVA